MVIANDYRHPVGVARGSASLDILSEGRFELGIGTGWIKEQYDAMAWPTTHRRCESTGSRRLYRSSSDVGAGSHSPSPVAITG